MQSALPTVLGSMAAGRAVAVNGSSQERLAARLRMHVETRIETAGLIKMGRGRLRLSELF